MSLKQSPSLDDPSSHESSPALLAQHSNKLMRVIFLKWWRKGEFNNFGSSPVLLACPSGLRACRERGGVPWGMALSVCWTLGTLTPLLVNV